MAMAGAWLLSLWSWFMGWFKPIWIKLCRWLMAPPFFVPAASARVHKAVVIGDGLAMGLGDRVILGSSGGVASKLQDMIAAKAGKKSPRTGWLVYNCGEVDSTSFDWLPGSASGPDGKKGKGYFGKVFNGVYGRDAEVVIVMLGTSDVLKGVDGMSPAVLAAQPPGQTNVKARYQPADYCATVANLKEICAALLAGNPVRRVLVCDVMSMKDYKVTLGRRGEVLYRLNHQLMDMLADLGGEAADSSTSSSSSGGGGGSGGESGGSSSSSSSSGGGGGGGGGGKKRVLWVHLSPQKVVARQWARCGDLVHLSSRGYKELARWLKDSAVVDAMLAVELHWWQRKLGGAGGKKKA
jgi:hypothetical protein